MCRTEILSLYKSETHTHRVGRRRIKKQANTHVRKETQDWYSTRVEGGRGALGSKGDKLTLVFESDPQNTLVRCSSRYSGRPEACRSLSRRDAAAAVSAPSSFCSLADEFFLFVDRAIFSLRSLSPSAELCLSVCLSVCLSLSPSPPAGKSFSFRRPVWLCYLWLYPIKKKKTFRFGSS